MFIAVIIGIFVFLFGGLKSSSVTIDVKEEIPLPISIVLEYGQETIVLYESDTIITVVEELTDYSDVADGIIYLTIGDGKYEILSYLDRTDRPIIEIEGDAASLEVRAYTTLYQRDKTIYQSTTIPIQE